MALLGLENKDQLKVKGRGGGLWGFQRGNSPQFTSPLWVQTSVGPWGRGDEPEMDPALEGSAVLEAGLVALLEPDKARALWRGNVLWIFTDFLQSLRCQAEK